jgi:hypothetical protein
LKKLLCIFFSVCLLACSKQEIVLIEGNTPPQEQLVTSAMKLNYINKLYITLLGRKATATEVDAGLITLGDKALQAQRALLINNLTAHPEAAFQLYEVARNDFLDGVDTATIQREYQFILAQLNLATGTYREYLLLEQKRLSRLRSVPYGLLADTISMAEMHRRIVDNAFYDEINMGTENFVVASFQNFLFRYPTQVELREASNMIGGVAGYLFFTNGSSKADFLQLFFSSDDYLEGQVIDLYKKYLFRNPASSEMVSMTLAYSQHGDYAALQTQILASDAYFFN